MSDGKIPSGHLLSKNVDLHLEVDRINEWERKRSCLNEPADWFDADASLEDHKRAAMVCKVECPVRSQCQEDVMLRRESGLSGIYAGLMWDGLQGPQTVEFWHRSHKPRSERSRENKFPAGWSEERHCKRCNTRFVITASLHSKKYCSDTCRTDDSYERYLERKKASGQ